LGSRKRRSNVVQTSKRKHSFNECLNLRTFSNSLLPAHSRRISLQRTAQTLHWRQTKRTFEVDPRSPNRRNEWSDHKWPTQS
jgi:hypothetical protein